jgi:hypothetical protein
MLAVSVGFGLALIGYEALIRFVAVIHASESNKFPRPQWRRNPT